MHLILELIEALLSRIRILERGEPLPVRPAVEADARLVHTMRCCVSCGGGGCSISLLLLLLDGGDELSGRVGEHARIGLAAHDELRERGGRVDVPLVGARVGRAARLARRLEVHLVLVEQLDVRALDERRLILLGVVGYVHLLELGLLLGELDALLLHVAVGRLPHVVVLDEALHALPRQVLAANVGELLAQLVQRVLEQVRLGRRPVLELVLAHDRTAARAARLRTRDQHARRVAEVVVGRVQQVHGVHDGDVARGRRGAQRQTRLLERVRAVERATERAHRLGQHQKLVNVRLGELLLLLTTTSTRVEF